MAENINLKLSLAYYIKGEFIKEFKLVHFTGNILKHISVVEKEDRVLVVIDPQIYDLGIYFKTRAIVNKSEGSYASLINATGGRSKKHFNYVDKCIKQGVQKWIKANHLETKIS